MLCDGQGLRECFLAGVADELIMGHTDLPMVIAGF
jgi:predicted patatin/cPLA2 family phospholipase